MTPDGITWKPLKPLFGQILTEAIENQIAAAIAEEREACAKEAENYESSYYDSFEFKAKIAASIRARGK